jgi:hypothetical protein
MVSEQVRLLAYLSLRWSLPGERRGCGQSPKSAISAYKPLGRSSEGFRTMSITGKILQLSGYTLNCILREHNLPHTS